jgi:hypothetical protein
MINAARPTSSASNGLPILICNRQGWAARSELQVGLFLFGIGKRMIATD